MKEIIEKKKKEKGKKELLRECKDILTEMLLDWRMTLPDAEDTNYLTLKEKLKMERNCENEKEIARECQEEDQVLSGCNVAKKMTSEDDLLYDENGKF